jgi:ParB-like chromosome segregation protein Spo0J
MKELLALLEKELKGSKNKSGLIAAVRKALHAHSPQKQNPVDLIQWIPYQEIEANDYNPNSVATNEMRLLYTSIMADGFTQPAVVIYDPKKKKYVLIDGFHRFTTVRLNKDLQARTHGCVPCVVLEKNINERMASTVRHNRARGKHSMQGMGNMVMQMLDQGMEDAAICKELGMEADELVRLKHVTGFSKLFENVEYRAAWETRKQLRIRKDFEKAHPTETTIH